MAVTPNYGWPIPVATDYVKDGWDAIADLGNAIDTTLGGFSTGALVKLASGSYSAVSAVNMTNLLSSTYKFYRLMNYHYGSTPNYPDYKFRENTTDKSTGYFYGGGGGNWNGSNYNPASGGSGTVGFTVSEYGASASYPAMLVMDIYRPDATTGVVTAVGYGDWDNRGYSFAGRNIAMSNFTGLTISTGTGTMTGYYALYAYN